MKEKVELLDKVITNLENSDKSPVSTTLIPAAYTGKVTENLLSQINCLILSSEEINSVFSDLLYGYELFDVDDYLLKENEQTLFGEFLNAFDAKSESFELPDDLGLIFDEEFSEKQVIDAEVKNLKNLLPIASFQGNFLVVSLFDDSYGSLWIVEGYNLLLLAPGIVDHFVDIKQGIDDKAYFFSEEDDLVFPSLWTQRKGVRLGDLKMDGYGEVKRR